MIIEHDPIFFNTLTSPFSILIRFKVHTITIVSKLTILLAPYSLLQINIEEVYEGVNKSTIKIGLYIRFSVTYLIIILL